jgi:putative ABC transport system permease protein
MGSGSFLKQSFEITRLNVLTLPRRLGSSAATVFGVAGVVAVFVGVLSIGAGFRKTLSSTGGPSNVIVLRGGTDTEMNSLLGRRSTNVVADGPGIARTAEGETLASTELFVIVDLPKRSTGTLANVPLRGVGPRAFEVRDSVEIIAGRRFTTGRNEILVGVAAAAEFAGLDLGNTLRWGDNEWTVVGIFRTGGTIAESELWCDVGVLAPAYKRGNTYQSVYARLESPERFAELKASLTSDPRLDVAVLKESDYFAGQSQALVGIVNGLGFVITFLMALGAIFGAFNTMYTSVSARTREIATLRAIGFPAAPVVVSVLLESVFLSLLGGAIGAGAAYLAFDGYRAATLNWQSFSQVAFAFAVTPALLIGGLLWALVIGLFGGLFPALRAARMPVTAALREGG